MRPKRILNTGWYDGPTEGWFESPDGTAWFFRLLVRKALEDRDDRIYLLGPTDLDFETIWCEFQQVEPPASRASWSPRWQFDTDEKRRQANALVERLRSHEPSETFLLVDHDEFPRAELNLVPLGEKSMKRLLWLIGLADPVARIDEAFRPK